MEQQEQTSPTEKGDRQQGSSPDRHTAAVPVTIGALNYTGSEPDHHHQHQDAAAIHYRKNQENGLIDSQHHNHVDNEHTVVKHAPYDVYNVLLPLLIRPARLAHKQRSHEWIPSAKLAPEWLALFYDLSFVAMLGVFSSQHEIQNAHQMGNFASYFVLIYWVWLSQISFDVRYQANDWWSRFCKFFQLVALTYLGAASGNWDVSFVVPVTDFMAPDAPLQQAGYQSFRSVAIAFATCRGLLALQYLVLIVLAALANRPRMPVVLPCCVTTISMILASLSAGLGGTSHAEKVVKVALLYLGILIEVIGDIGSFFFLSTHIRYAPDRMSERLACLSLIILGEGIITILRAFNLSLSIFSENDGPLYGQILGALTVIYLTFLLSFEGFNKHTWLGKKRTVAWCLCQFPLHFCLLILLAALANAVIAGAYINGTTDISSTYFEVLFVLPNRIPEASNRTLTLQLGKLTLDTDFQEEMQFINASAAAGDQGYVVEGIKYLADILIQSAVVYNVELSHEGEALNDQLQAIHSVGLNNHTVTEPAKEALQLMTEIIGEILTECVQGTLWLFPAAGGVLFLSSISQVIRYERPGRILGAVEAVQIGVALVLCLLGLLNTTGTNKLIFHFVSVGEDTVIGTTDRTSSLFNLVIAQWAIGAIAIVFLLLFLVKMGILAWARRRHRQRKCEADSEIPTQVAAGPDSPA